MKFKYFNKWTSDLICLSLNEKTLSFELAMVGKILHNRQAIVHAIYTLHKSPWIICRNWRRYWKLYKCQY